MSDEFPDRGDGTPSTTSFEEWLDQQAKSQGISREELFDRLISSYWTLNEMMQLLDDSGGSDPGSDRSRSRSSDDDPRSAPRIGHTPGGDRSGRAPSGESRTGTPPAGSGLDPVESEEPPSGGRSGDAPADDRIDALADRVESLTERLERETDRGQSLDEFADSLAARLTRIEADLDELEADATSAHDALESEHDALADRIESLEADLTDRQASLADEQRSLADEQQQVRRWLDSEFDSLQTILEYLVSQTDELDAHLSSAEERYEAELSRLRAERAALRSLKEEAAALGVRAGECESCGTEIDLGLLEHASCPDCDAPLSGVDARDRWLVFTDYVVTTEEDGGVPSAARQAPPAERSDTSPARQPAASPADPAVDFSGIGEPPPQTSERPESDHDGAGTDAAGRDGNDPQTRIQIGTPNAAEDASDGTAAERDDAGDGDERGPDTAFESPFGDLSDLQRQEGDGADD
ncbi:hypothetical protein [Halobellus sp. GM3]|uniref:hypothetical protein n=1 Tax=Halobellus sp. GM3 TaxID=3458410 RepID=UPI00403D6571